MGYCSLSFGSLAGSSYGAKRIPDVDVGILLDDKNPYSDTLEAKIKMEIELNEFVGKSFGKIDLSILNDAPPVFVHEVIRSYKM
ncbi:MAG: nucleotidyltransferase domain-containing protein [bacterium]|nr:nucleotidyltransferase domain-containing protein [bacterium]